MINKEWIDSLMCIGVTGYSELHGKGGVYIIVGENNKGFTDYCVSIWDTVIGTDFDMPTVLAFLNNAPTESLSELWGYTREFIVAMCKVLEIYDLQCPKCGEVFGIDQSKDFIFCGECGYEVDIRDDCTYGNIRAKFNTPSDQEMFEAYLSEFN